MKKNFELSDKTKQWKKGESGNPSTQWKPGECPNPGGRPKKTPITDALRDLLKNPYDGKIAKYRGMTNATVIAIKLFDLVIENGDMQAAKEIADRVEEGLCKSNSYKVRTASRFSTRMYLLRKMNVASQN